MKLQETRRHELQPRDESYASPKVLEEPQGKEGIAELAYYLNEQRGRVDRHDREDWFEAEKRLVSWD